MHNEEHLHAVPTRCVVPFPDAQCRTRQQNFRLLDRNQAWIQILDVGFVSDAQLLISQTILLSVSSHTQRGKDCGHIARSCKESVKGGWGGNGSKRPGSKDHPILSSCQMGIDSSSWLFGTAMPLRCHEGH